VGAETFPEWAATRGRIAQDFGHDKIYQAACSELFFPPLCDTKKRFQIPCYYSYALFPEQNYQPHEEISLTKESRAKALVAQRKQLVFSLRLRARRVLLFVLLSAPLLKAACFSVPKL